MQPNDKILITFKAGSGEPYEFIFLKFSKNIPLNCDGYFDAKQTFTEQSTIIVLSNKGEVNEYTLASVTIQKLFNNLHDKV